MRPPPWVAMKVQQGAADNQADHTGTSQGGENSSLRITSHKTKLSITPGIGIQESRLPRIPSLGGSALRPVTSKLYKLHAPLEEETSLSYEESGETMHVFPVDFALWEVVRASTAAPTYFPGDGADLDLGSNLTFYLAS